MTHFTFPNKKYLRMPVAKPKHLRVAFGKDDIPDIYYCHGAGIRKGDSNMLLHFFNEVKGDDGKTMLEELESRGYDLSTIEFSIKKKE